MAIRVVLAVAVASALVLMPAGAAGAASTDVTIKANGGDFSGKVKSSKASCKADRKVTVYKVVKSGSDAKVGSDLSEDDGKWSTGNSGQKRGKFYAKVKKSAGCSAAKSKVIKLGD